jgi:hypothetical protein
MKITYESGNATAEAEKLQREAEAKAKAADDLIKEQQPAAEEAAATLDKAQAKRAQVAATGRRASDEMPVAAKNLSALRNESAELEKANETAAQAASDPSLEEDTKKAATDYGVAQSKALGAEAKHARASKLAAEADEELDNARNETEEALGRVKLSYARQKEAEQATRERKLALNGTAQEREAAANESKKKFNDFADAKALRDGAKKDAKDADEALKQNTQAIEEVTNQSKALAKESAQASAHLMLNPGQLDQAEANSSELNATIAELEEAKAEAEKEVELQKQIAAKAAEDAKHAEKTLTRSTDELQAEIDELNRLNRRLVEAQDRQAGKVVDKSGSFRCALPGVVVLIMAVLAK